jgi:hypothetical protein
MQMSDDGATEEDLEAYRKRHGLSYQGLADLIGLSQAKQAREYALGHRWPRDASVLNTIESRTGVSITAMHKRRNEYQRGER